MNDNTWIAIGMAAMIATMVSIILTPVFLGGGW
jgi:hypothetical protein